MAGDNNIDLAVKATLDTSDFERKMEALPGMAARIRAQAKAKGSTVSGVREEVSRVAAVNTSAAQGAQRAGLISEADLQQRIAKIDAAVNKLVSRLSQELGVAAEKIRPSPTRVNTLAGSYNPQVHQALQGAEVRHQRAVERQARAAERAAVEAEAARAFRPTKPQATALQTIIQHGGVVQGRQSGNAETGHITYGSADTLTRAGIIRPIGDNRYGVTRIGQQAIRRLYPEDEGSYRIRPYVQVPQHLLERSAAARTNYFQREKQAHDEAAARVQASMERTPAPRPAPATETAVEINRRSAAVAAAAQVPSPSLESLRNRQTFRDVERASVYGLGHPSLADPKIRALQETIWQQRWLDQQRAAGRPDSELITAKGRIRRTAEAEFRATLPDLWGAEERSPFFPGRALPVSIRRPSEIPSDILPYRPGFSGSGDPRAAALGLGSTVPLSVAGGTTDYLTRMQRIAAAASGLTLPGQPLESRLILPSTPITDPRLLALGRSPIGGTPSTQPWGPWAPAPAGPGPAGPLPGAPFPATPGAWRGGAATPPGTPPPGGLPPGALPPAGGSPRRPWFLQMPWTLGSAGDSHDPSNPLGPVRPTIRFPGDMLANYERWAVPSGVGSTRGVPGTVPAGFGDLEAFGIKEGIDRTGGQQIRIAYERYLQSIIQVSLELHAEATSLENLRKAQEQAARETRRASDLRSGPLRPATIDATRAAELRAVVERAAKREGRAPVVDAQGQQDALDAVQRLERERAALQERLGIGSAPLEGEVRARRTQVAAQAKRAEADRLLSEQQAAEAANRRGPIDDLARSRVYGRELKRQIARREMEEQRRAGFDDLYEGTFTQRVQARIARRDGTPPRPVTDYQTLPQLLSSKALTTASFALTGGLLYGGLALGKDILQEATQLQQELAIIRTQFQGIGEDADSVSFKHMREEIHGISVEVGVQADEVAKVIRQLSGAFADSSGLPDFKRAAEESRVALQYTKISGLPQQEITDSLTAMSLAFRDAQDTPMPFEHILDGITDMENRFGVLGPEILKFAADLAPQAKQLGLTFDQITGLGAVAQQRSGKSGQVLSEQLGRILPALTENSLPLAEVLARNSETRSLGEQMFAAFKTGDTVKGLETLINAYQKLNDKQKQAVVLAVGGPRQAGTFAALLDNPDQTLGVLRGEDAGESSAAGAHKKRWDAYSQTVTHAMEVMRRSVEEFGQKLFEAGVGDALTSIAVAGKGLLDVVEKMVGVIGALNGALGGIPAKAVGAYIAMRAITSIWSGGGIGALRYGGLTAGFTQLFNPRTGPITPPLVVPPLKPSVVRASGYPLVGGLIGRGAEGEFGAFGSGAATVASVAIPTVVAAGVVFGTQKLLEAQSRRAANERKQAEQIAADFAQGQTREEFFKKYGGSQGRPGYKKDTSSPEKIGNALVNTFGAIKATWSGGLSGEIAYAREIADAGGVASDPDQVAAWRARKKVEAKSKSVAGVAGLRALRDMTAEERARRFASSDVVLGKEGEKRFRTDAGKLSFSEKRINRLITDYKDDPENKGVAKLVRDLVKGGDDEVSRAYFSSIDASKRTADVNKVVKKILKGKEDGGTDAKYADSIKAYQALLKAGDVGVGTVAKVMRDQIDYQKGLVEQMRAAGATSDDIAAAQADVNASEGALAAQALEVESAADQLFEKTLALRGVPAADRAAVGLARKISTRNYLRRSGGSPLQLGQSAMDILTQQEAVIASRNKGAMTASQVDTSFTPSGIEQRDLIAAQLVSGAQNQAAIDALTQSGAFGDDGSDVAGELARQIQNAGGVDKLRAQLLTRIQQLRGGERTKVRRDQLAAAKAALKAINNIGPITDDFSNLDLGVEQAVADIGKNQDLAKVRGLRASGGRDTVKAAQYDLDKAREQLAATPETADNYRDRQLAFEQAQTAYDEAERARAINLRQAAVDLRKAQHYGDTGYAVRADLEAARAALADARTPEERAAAALAVQNAANASSQFAKDQVQKASRYRQALLQGDTVAQSQEALRAAQAAVASATPDEKYDALTQLAEAQRRLQQSLLDVFIAQKDLAISVAEGAGDNVKVALLQLQQAQERLRAAQASGAKGAQLYAAQAEVNRAQTNLTNVVRADKLGDLEYMYEFDKLTATAYIAQLKLELAKIPESNKEARREIERRIKSLREEMSANLTFNIPTEVNLPTLYEARRGRGATEAAAAGNGSGTYQDNRRIQVVVDGAQDPVAVAEAVVDALAGDAKVSATADVGFGDMEF